jgi:hypothetical protein
LFGPPPPFLFPVASSGAGSGSMEFGGHHPLLGHLVMKHGGHKDLAVLVSLARIESETGARATFAIDSLPRHPPVAALPPQREHVGPPPSPRQERVGRPPHPPPGDLATSPRRTEPAGVTGPPRPAPAVRRDAARRVAIMLSYSVDYTLTTARCRLNFTEHYAHLLFAKKNEKKSMLVL